MLKLSQVKPKIWHLHFDTRYDLALHFFRYQESTDTEIISMIDLMERYSKNFGKGDFTYTKDWVGFNLPGRVILDLHRRGIKDINKYDNIMLAFAEMIKSKEGTEDFDIIGTSGEDSNFTNTFNHELAHSLYSHDKRYKNKITKLLKELPVRTHNRLYNKLIELGYQEELNDFLDEIQAYLCNGSDGDFFGSQEFVKYSKKFKAVFKQHAKDLAK